MKSTDYKSIMLYLVILMNDYKLIALRGALKCHFIDKLVKDKNLLELKGFIPFLQCLCIIFNLRIILKRIGK